MITRSASKTLTLIKQPLIVESLASLKEDARTRFMITCSFKCQWSNL